MPKLKSYNDNQAAKAVAPIYLGSGVACSDMRCGPCGRKHRQNEMQGYNNRDEDGNLLGLDLEAHAHAEPCPGEMMVPLPSARHPELEGLVQAVCGECGMLGWV